MRSGATERSKSRLGSLVFVINKFSPKWLQSQFDFLGFLTLILINNVTTLQTTEKINVRGAESRIRISSIRNTWNVRWCRIKAAAFGLYTSIFLTHTTAFPIFAPNPLGRSGPRSLVPPLPLPTCFCFLNLKSIIFSSSSTYFSPCSPVFFLSVSSRHV